MRREFLQLAHNYDADKHHVSGWYISEKLDGMRAYWDGGITRGTLTSDVAFANTTKDFRRIVPPRSTGLWTRYAKPIAAPDWFLDLLPEGLPLDGELYMGRGRFQELMSTVKQFVPDGRWDQVEYIVFDSPPDATMFSSGKINNPTWSMNMPDLRHLYSRNLAESFWKTYNKLLVKVPTNKWVSVHEQTRLSCSTATAKDQIDHMLSSITDNGGEGVMLRKPESVWVPKRTTDLLKVKKLLDSEAVITGYVPGKGKLLGLMGSAIVNWKGIVFELSGFTDEERRMDGDVNPMFPIGSVVTFRYREVTNDGKPKEARYWRKA